VVPPTYTHVCVPLKPLTPNRFFIHDLYRKGGLIYAIVQTELLVFLNDIPGEDSTICQADRTGHLGDRQEEEEEMTFLTALIKYNRQFQRKKCTLLHTGWGGTDGEGWGGVACVSERDLC
jgi:hypothetical protein